MTRSHVRTIRPISLLQCLDSDGEVDIKKYQSYLRYQSDQRRHNIASLVASTYAAERKYNNDVYNSGDYEFDDGDEEPPLLEKKKRKKKGLMARRTEGGELEIIKPQQSSWYQMYVDNEIMKEAGRYQDKFRLRFRLPYDKYLDLVNDCKNADEYFGRWQRPDATGKMASPIELLVLGVLRYLGRGWTFDDIEESTSVSKEVHRVFFHRFIDFGSTVLYNKYVNMPLTYAEAKRHMAEYAAAGLNGGCGSSDCCHVLHEKCDYNLRQNHLGGKDSHTTHTFSTTVNHRHRILHTKGGPGRWNDQTMVRFDEFVSGIKDGTILEDVEFELFERDRTGEIITAKYRGGYVIVDNGYLRWSVTVPPFKVTNKETEIRWSKWIESMRKDVECTFGILKGRWRILKTGIRTHDIDSVDKVWKTCCALHNWLLEIDGLDDEWTGGVPTSDWTGSMGEHDFEGVSSEIPNAIARLSTNLEPRHYDISGMGPGLDDTGVPDHQVQLDLGLDSHVPCPSAYVPGTEVRIVNQLGLGFFRQKLVEHFDILWRQNRIVWPTRKGTSPPIEAFERVNN